MRKLLLGFAMAATMVSAQTKTYLDQQFREVQSADQAAWYREVQTDPANGRTTSSIRNADGKLKEFTEYADREMKIRDGRHESYKIDGTPQLVAHYKNNLRDGESRWYYPDGTLKRIETYAEDNRTGGICYGPDGKEIPFFEYEIRPQFPGGAQKLYEYIAANFRNPTHAKGRLLVSFTVNADGGIVSPQVVKGISAQPDAEAVRVVSSMGKWIPGQQEGRPVPMKFSLPITLDPPDAKGNKTPKLVGKHGKRRKPK
jgi:protein TonB